MSNYDISKIKNPDLRDKKKTKIILDHLSSLEYNISNKDKHNYNYLETYTQEDDHYDYDNFLKHYLTNITNNPITLLKLNYLNYSDSDYGKKERIIYPTIIDALKESGYELLAFNDKHSDSTYIDYIFRKDGCYIIIDQYDFYDTKIIMEDDKKYPLSTTIDTFNLYVANGLTTSDLIIDIFTELINLIGDNSKKIKHDIDDVKLSIIVESQFSGYQIETKTISKGHNFENIDLHYGKGFEETYNQLIDVVSNNKKGLIIFNGNPGTGKTYCIHDFIRKIKNKKPVFISSSIFMKLTDPSFIHFLLNESQFLEKDQDNLLFIVEDSENLIKKRDDNNMSTDGISNLLNSTDGLLNGMLNIQALLTFNTDINNIDQALLRNERLIGHMEFGNLPKDNIEKLVEILGIKEVPKDFYNDSRVVADVYSLLKGRQTVRYSISKEDDNKKYIF